MTQLQELAKPFPNHLIKQAPAGKYGSYVPHSAITERLLSIVGPFDMRIVDTFQGDKGLEGIVLEMTFTIDGRQVTVQEAGDCELPSNWKTEGARLKDAVSDGVKRCAMRVGLGLHLWSQNDYFLETQLAADDVAIDEPDPTVFFGNTAPPTLEVEPQLSPGEKRMNTIKTAAWNHTDAALDTDERISEGKQIVEQALSVYGGEPKNAADVAAIVANIDAMFDTEGEES